MEHNPYQPIVLPSRNFQATLVPPQTRIQRLLHSFLFCAGSIVGLNVCAVLDDGFTKPLKLFKADPLNAVIFFLCFSPSILCVFAVFKLVRGRLALNHQSPAWLRFAMGIFYPVTLYCALEAVSWCNMVGPWAICVTVVVGTICVVEIEALVIRICTVIFPSVKGEQSGEPELPNTLL